MTAHNIMLKISENVDIIYLKYHMFKILTINHCLVCVSLFVKFMKMIQSEYM